MGTNYEHLNCEERTMIQLKAGLVGNQRGNNQFVHGCPMPYERSRGCTQLTGGTSSSDMLALRSMLS
jgi:hypothetical protein